MLKVCDLVEDCSNGEDELDCMSETSKKVNNFCDYDEFQCHDHLECIPAKYVCDKNCKFEIIFKKLNLIFLWLDDCFDGSDELNCTRSCDKELEFRCANSQCIPISMLCDGESECLDDSDELYCDNTINNNSLFNCSEGYRFNLQEQKCLDIDEYDHF